MTITTVMLLLVHYYQAQPNPDPKLLMSLRYLANQTECAAMGETLGTVKGTVQKILAGDLECPNSAPNNLQKC